VITGTQYEIIIGTEESIPAEGSPEEFFWKNVQKNRES